MATSRDIQQVAGFPASTGIGPADQGTLRVALPNNQVFAVSGLSFPLPAGAATEATLQSIDAGIPASLGQKQMQNSMSVAFASDQSPIVISGTVAIGSVNATIVNQPTVIQGNSTGAPWIISGTVIVGNPTTASVIQANQGFHGPEPWAVSGTVVITGTVPVSFSNPTVIQGNSTGAPWIVSGTVVSSITGTVPVSFSNPTVVQGNSTGAPWIVSGTTVVSNTVTTNTTIVSEPAVVQGNSTGAPWIVSGTVTVGNTLTTNATITNIPTVNQGFHGPEPWAISGTVVISNTIPVTFSNPTVIQGNSTGAPWIVSGTTVVSNTVTVGTHNVNQGFHGPEPWAVSGTVVITGTVPVSFSNPTVIQGNSTGAPWIVSGTVVSSITGTVPVSFSNPTVVQGNSTGAPWIVSGTVTVGNTLTTNATITNNPIVVQGNSTGAPWIVSGIALAAGLRNDNLVNLSGVNLGIVQSIVEATGRTIIAPYAPSTAMVRGTATVTGTSSTSLIAASTGGNKVYVTAVQISNSGATFATLTFQDGSGGTTLGYAPAPPSSGAIVNYPVPLVTSANTAFFFAAGASSTTISVSAQGYAAP